MRGGSGARVTVCQRAAIRREPPDFGLTLKMLRIKQGVEPCLLGRVRAVNGRVLGI